VVLSRALTTGPPGSGPAGVHQAPSHLAAQPAPRRFRAPRPAVRRRRPSCGHHRGSPTGRRAAARSIRQARFAAGSHVVVLALHRSQDDAGILRGPMPRLGRRVDLLCGTGDLPRDARPGVAARRHRAAEHDRGIAGHPAGPGLHGGRRSAARTAGAAHFVLGVRLGAGDRPRRHPVVGVGTRPTDRWPG
jgi:hypothetical protein